MRKLRPAKALEIAAWAIGAALVLVWAVIRLHGASAARTAVRQFEESRTAQARPEPAAGGPALALPLALVVAPTLDFALWSPERIDAFVAAGSVPRPALAVLRIPRIGLEAPVFEGTDDATLDAGVGRIDGTASFGERGNVGIAGHRDGFFRGLKDLACGDRIDVATPARDASYRVDEIRIVTPEDVEVLDPTAQDSLTLVTCYPFYYVGSAPRRYIVRAVLETPSGSM